MTIAEGQVVLFRFPQTDLQEGKLRPALVLRRLPGRYSDWLICMISSQLRQEEGLLDEFITPEDTDFIDSGLKVPSLVRGGRLAVVEEGVLLGRLGDIDSGRLDRIRKRIASWICNG